MRLAIEVALVAALILALSMSRCSGNRTGKIEAKLAQVETEKKAESTRADSLLMEVNLQKLVAKSNRDSLRDAERKYSKTRIEYRTLRDTVTLSDTVEVEAILDLADQTLQAADSALVIAARVIMTQQEVIRMQDDVIRSKDESIRLMNQQIALLTKLRKPGILHRVASAAPWLMAAGVAGAITHDKLRE